MGYRLRNLEYLPGYSDSKETLPVLATRKPREPKIALLPVYQE